MAKITGHSDQSERAELIEKRKAERQSRMATMLETSRVNWDSAGKLPSDYSIDDPASQARYSQAHLADAERRLKATLAKAAASEARSATDDGPLEDI